MTANAMYDVFILKKTIRYYIIPAREKKRTFKFSFVFFIVISL